jgi:hypothetical protein
MLNVDETETNASRRNNSSAPQTMVKVRLMNVAKMYHSASKMSKRWRP